VIAAALGLLSGVWGKALPWLIMAGVVAVAVVLFVSRVFGAGKTAAKAEAAMDALHRTRDANEARARASQPISRGDEANDPQNRDRI